MSTLEPYMRAMVEMRKQNFAIPPGYQYRCFEDYVLQKGSMLTSSPLTDEEEAIVQEALDRMAEARINVHEMKQCFSNAQQLLLFADVPELVYYEGYACGRLAGFAVHHGWLGINGKVIDLTWRLESPNTSRSLLPHHPVGQLPDGYEYWGFPVECVDYLRFRVIAREAVGSVLEDWEGDFPLLRGIDPNDKDSWSELALED